VAGDAPPADFVLRDWLVQPALSRMSRQGRTVHLRPKLMDLLVFLASLDGRVAGRQEIFDAVWHGEFVAESVLGRSIADLRRLL
jgi:DNA-binding winged helix-turn-helix (wHTH) protein